VFLPSSFRADCRTKGYDQSKGVLTKCLLLLSFLLMSSIIDLSSEQLRRAADLKEKISALEQELAGLLGSPVATNGAVANGTSPVAAPAEKKRKKISAAGLARIKAAQKLRWAKFHKETAPAEKVSAKKKKFTMSAEAKAKIAAAARARWARVRAAKNA
jgi:hypothetical protein